MNPRDRVGLQHLADPLNSAIRFAQGRERGDLDSDEMQLFALVRAIEVAGEAASQVTAETRAQQPEERVPWMRPEDHAHMLDGLRKAGWQAPAATPPA